MIRRLPRPRLLPLLLGGLALLLIVKLGSAALAVLQVATSGRVSLVAAAQAESNQQTAQAPQPPAAAASTAPRAPTPARPDPSAAAARTEPPAPASASCDIPPTAAAERVLLEALRTRRSEIDRREQAVAEREMLLAATERRLSERVDGLAALQGRLEAAEQARTGRDDAGWRQMVKLYEGMRPRDAATIFDDLEMPVLVQILSRMGERKAAPVLGAMRPERARLLTAELARHRAAQPLN